MKLPQSIEVADISCNQTYNISMYKKKLIKLKAVYCAKVATLLHSFNWGNHYETCLQKHNINDKINKSFSAKMFQQLNDKCK